VQVGGVGLTGGTLDVILSVYNPNGYRLDATRITYKVMVDSLDVGAGALDPATRRAWRGTSELSVVGQGVRPA